MRSPLHHRTPPEELMPTTSTTRSVTTPKPSMLPMQVVQLSWMMSLPRARSLLRRRPVRQRVLQQDSCVELPSAVRDQRRWISPPRAPCCLPQAPPERNSASHPMPLLPQPPPAPVQLSPPLVVLPTALFTVSNSTSTHPWTMSWSSVLVS